MPSQSMIFFAAFHKMTIEVLLPNSGSATHCSEANNQEISVNRKERCFNQKNQQSEGKVDSRPKETNSKDSTQP